MFQRIRQFFPSIRLKRAVLIGSIAVITALALLVTLLVALPSILSMAAVQIYLRDSLTRSLKRQVTWSELGVSWSRGLRLKGLVLGAGPPPLLKMTVAEMYLVPELGRSEGRWRAYLSLGVSGISADCAPGPPKPPKPYKEPLTAIAEAVQRFEGMDWPLPLELGGAAVFGPVNVVWHNPDSGRSLTLQNLDLRLDMPSLADSPVAVALRSGLLLDGRRLKDISLTGDLKGIVTAGRRIHPAAAVIDIRGAAPGAELSMAGGLQEAAGFAARGRLHLADVIDAYGPLLPKAVPTLRGEAAFELSARFDGAKNIQCTMELNGSRLALSGGRLRNGQIGPLDISLRQKMVSDRQRQQVRFMEGGVRIGRLLEASWDATVDRPAGRDRDLTAQLGPVWVDLQQAQAVAAPLLPPKLPVRELSGEMALQRLTATMHGRGNRGDITLEKLAVAIPRIRLALAGRDISAQGVDLAVDRATVPFEGRRPGRVEAALSYDLRRFAVGGAQPFAADGLKGGLQLALTDLNLKSGSPRRFAATAEMKQSLDLRRAELEKRLIVDALHQQLTALVRFRENGEIEVTLPELKIAAGAVQAKSAGRQLKPLPLTALASAGGIRIAAARGALPVVERASFELNGSDFLQLSATGSLTGGSSRTAVSDGSLRMDLGRLLPVAAPFLPKDAAAGGTASLAWSLAAPVRKQPPARAGNPLAKARAALAKIERGDIAVSLDSRAISWPLKSGRLTIADLHTLQPLRLTLPGGSGKINLSGGVAFSGLSGLAGSVRRLPVQSGSLSLNGELTEWQSLRLHEELRTEPFGLVQKADVTAGRIDLLLEKQQSITAAALLQQLDALVTSDLEVRFPQEPVPVFGRTELSGGASGKLRLELDAGRELRLQASAVARDFGVRLANGTVVEGVRADLSADRSYALAKGEPSGWTPLTQSLVRPGPEPVAAAGAGEIFTRVREDLRGQESGSRKFTVRRLVTGNQGKRLELTSLEGDLLLGPEEMGLSFFQTEVLGGTVRLRSMIDLRPEIPAVSVACSFSNLETFLLLPAEIRVKYASTKQDSGITGEISLDSPLQTGRRELLEGIRMRLNLRKIGADTLERALFSLDPEERNEQLVKQRKQLRHGSLQILRANVLDGAASLDGEMKVKGVTVAIPKVERIRLSELPIGRQMAKTLAGIASLRKLLDLARADTIVAGPAGKISLARRGEKR